MNVIAVLAPYTNLILGVINLLGAVLIIHYEYRNPRAAVLWLLILFLVPAFGLIPYFLFGRSMQRTRRSFRTKEAKDHQRLEDLIQSSAIDGSPAVLDEDGLAEYAPLARMLQANQSFLTTDNQVRLINTGEEKFRLLFRDLEGAMDHIHAEYYIVRNDELGRRFLEVLARKAEQGLEVRLLIDGVGTRLPRDRISELRKRGVRVLAFFPPVWERFPALNLRVNHRNHRKIVVIDGRIGYLGGYNIGDEYLGKDHHLGSWRDTHLRIEGSAVLDLQARFLLDWRFSSADGSETSPRYFPHEGAQGTGAVQIVSGGPDKRLDLVKETYLKMISSARHRVYLQSPYFVPDSSVLDALRVSALSGVDVRIMVPRTRDHLLVHWANLAYLGELVESGVKAYLYQGGFLHAKTIVVDGAIASVGSANWDIRSLELNFETNAMIYGRRLAREQEETFLQDLRSCQPWTLADHQARSAWVKVKCSFARVFSPLL
jgi:cardiolipin synthase A/B